MLYDMVYHSAPLILCVLGGIFAYKANVLNIALEGMLLLGAFTSALFVLWTGNLWLGILLSILAVLLLGAVFALFSITLKSNFIITGLGINLFVTALSSFMLSFMNMPNINVSGIVDTAALKLEIPILKEIPILGPMLSGHTALTYFSFLCILLVSLLMFKTKFGTYVRVVGENEDAAKAVGINVTAIKYGAVLIGAVLCALAGANMSVERMVLYTDIMVAGWGFIAIGGIFCGMGMPLRTTGYAVVFGLTRSLAVNLAINAGAISGLLEMVPYLLIVIVLTVVSAFESKRTKLRGFQHA
ncbi:MAG: ABC transporter permease [Clostridiales bacterium]|nr:ABC transporter permease [Clostridiales bacterium]